MNISTSYKNMPHRLGCKEIYKLLTRIECFIVSNKISSLKVHQRQADTAASISESPCGRYLSQGIRHINILPNTLLRISEVGVNNLKGCLSRAISTSEKCGFGVQPTIWFISKIGSRIEITINPTITAIKRIIIGSIRAVIPVIRVSTSRS